MSKFLYTADTPAASKGRDDDVAELLTQFQYVGDLSSSAGATPKERLEFLLYTASTDYL